MTSGRFLDWHWNRITGTAHTLLRPVRSRLGPSPRILDLGCGDGRQALDIFRFFESPRIFGVDRDADSLSKYRRRFADRGFNGHAILGDALHADKLLKGKFDLLHEYGMSEQIGEPSPFFLSAARVLRPGGLMLFQYGMSQSYGAIIYDKSMRAKGHSLKYLVRRDTAEFQAIMRRSGAPFRVLSQKAIWHYYRDEDADRGIPLAWDIADAALRLRAFPPSGVYALLERTLRDTRDFPEDP